MPGSRRQADTGRYTRPRKPDSTTQFTSTHAGISFVGKSLLSLCHTRRESKHLSNTLYSSVYDSYQQSFQGQHTIECSSVRGTFRHDSVVKCLCHWHDQTANCSDDIPWLEQMVRSQRPLRRCAHCTRKDLLFVQISVEKRFEHVYQQLAVARCARVSIATYLRQSDRRPDKAQSQVVRPSLPWARLL